MLLKTRLTYSPTMPRTFKEKLLSDDFLVTAEITPPKGTDLSKALEDAEILKGLADALNVTDNQRAVMRMSPLAVSKALLDKGHEVIMQLTCRDRNRLALQSDVLAAYSLGVRNICVMSGDHTTKGDHPRTKPVFDVDSVQLLGAIRKMKEGFDLSGNEIGCLPGLTVGAVSNTDPSKPMQLLKLRKKIKMGAEFVQTQAVYDTGQFQAFMEYIIDMDVPVIAGVIPLKSAKMARFMNDNIPGISVPPQMIKRMENAEDPAWEGLSICAQTIRELKGICRGVHVMPIGSHSRTPELLEMAGIRKGN
jgi:5,10-methylenetetrahydrofolate reductase